MFKQWGTENREDPLTQNLLKWYIKLKISVLWYSNKSSILCTLKNTFMFHYHSSVFTLDQRNFGIVDKLPTIICLVYDVANAFLPIHSNFKWVHKATWINKAVNRLP